MDLSKVFHYVPHDVLLSNLSAYGVDENYLCYLHSYLLNWEQRVQINNINSEFLNVVLGIPQRSIVLLILFSCLCNDSFTLTFLMNFVGDNTLATFSNIIQNLIHLLESGSMLAIKWFKDDKMIVNPKMFQVKKKNNYT